MLTPWPVTPGITAQEYADRRGRLAAGIGSHAVAVIASAALQYRSGSVFHEFHQDADFFYLTGFNEPEAVAVLETGSSAADYKFHLFVRPKDEEAERWAGARSGLQAALDVFNADETGDIADLSASLRPLVCSASKILTNVTTLSDSSNERYQLSSTTAIRDLLQGHRSSPIRSTMNELRIVKSEAEIANMRLAGKYSGRAFTDLMKRAWQKEKDLWAYLEYALQQHGCEKSAFLPVVASASNGACIHYVQNNDVLFDDKLVLVDAGGQYGGYITDITRTWPVSGKFSDAQRDLYSMVLQVQREVISLCRESSNMTLDQLQRKTEDGLRDGLRQLGFDVAGHAVTTLFPHHVSHHIGLDVHDCPGYSRATPLRQGHCVTVEPGIYVPDDDRWPAHFRGMAIRIEDSVCVQEDGPLVLSVEAVKEMVDVEALR